MGSLWRRALVPVLLVLLVSPAHAREEKLPAPRYALFVGRLLAYDTNLKSRAGDRVDIAILYERQHAPAQCSKAERLAPGQHGLHQLKKCLAGQ